MADPNAVLERLVNRQAQVIEAQKKASADIEAERAKVIEEQTAQPNQTEEQPPNVSA